MSEIPTRHVFIYAALALAGHYFPRHDEDGEVLAPFHNASFFATRKPQAWERWQNLSFEERRRIADVMSLAPTELADAKAFAVATKALLGALDDVGDDESEANRAVVRPFVLAGSVPSRADAARPHVGGDLLDYVDRITARFRRPSTRPQPPDFAGPGVWQTRKVYVTGEGWVHGKLTIPTYPNFAAAPDHSVLPTVSTASYTPEIGPTVKELLNLSELIQHRYEREADRYLYDTLSRLFNALRCAESDSAVEVLRLIAGQTQILNAPTGTGKTVLVRVLASWFAVQGLRIMLVVPDVKATLSTAWEISADLEFLHREGEMAHPASCVPLMSPNRRQERARKHAALIREDPHAPGEWGKRGLRDIDTLAYSCAQPRFLDTAGTYPAGQENCFSLERDNAYFACPWLPTCDKYAPVYAACEAAVVVTNHHNFVDGNLQVGLVLDGRPTRGVTVREFGLRTCHAVIIDEIDQFQHTVIDKCATHVVLHSRRPWTSAPQKFDIDAKKLPIRVETSLVNPVSHVRLMAEFLLLSICQGALHLTTADDEQTMNRRSMQHNAGWRLAHSRDRELIELLFPGVVAEGENIPPDLYAKLDSLLPARYGVPNPFAGTDLGTDLAWDDVRQALDALAAPRGNDFLDLVKLELHDFLTDIVPDARRRCRAINLLVVRGYLKELDAALSMLRDHVQLLRHSGLSSANSLLEAVHPKAVNSVLPLGMLGRAITGYRVTGLDNREKDAELSAQNIAGDPHTYVSELGGLVALLTARIERPVVGLSATAYFPQAVREHVHAPVAWWMTDAQARSIVAESHKITYGPGHALMGEAIRISGTHPAGKSAALVELGTRLYEKIAQKIEKLRRKDPDRARVILTANSYEQCTHLALGLTRAKGFNHRVCVAVPSDDPNRHAKYLPPASLAQPVTPEQFEDFPASGDILIAPLAVIARGLNIVVATRSAVQSIYLCTRPPLTIDEPAWMYGSINAAGISALPSGGSADPVEALRVASEEAWQQLGLILRSPTQFSAMTHTLQEQVIAGMLIDLIQLAGRARRGGTDMNLHLVDYAFQDETWSSDLMTIIKRIHSRWPPEVQQRMNDLYGEALGAFLSYAGIDPNRI